MDLTYALQLLDYLGVLAFALSGALKAARRKMDLFGMSVLALITAVGGGTVRDLLVGQVPVFWLDDHIYLALCVLAVGIVVALGRLLRRWERALLVFDAIGLAVFTVIGTERGLSVGLSGPVSVGLGALTGIGGGMMRDVLARSRPVVLHREIYALASLGGGALLVGLDALGLPRPANVLGCAAAVLAIRLLALRYGWALPRWPVGGSPPAPERSE